MKAATRTALFTLALLLVPVQMFVAQAQQEMYHVHEDIVKPGLAEEYDADQPRLVELRTKADVGVYSQRWVSNNHTVRLIWPVADVNTYFSDRAENNKKYATLTPSEQEEVLRLANTELVTHSNYFIAKDLTLSYRASEEDPGDYFKTSTFYADLSQGIRSPQEILSKWASLHRDKGAPLSFDIYRGGFGTAGEIMIMFRGKDEEDLAGRWAETRELLGPEGDAVWQEILSWSSRYVEDHGWVERTN